MIKEMLGYYALLITVMCTISVGMALKCDYMIKQVREYYYKSIKTNEEELNEVMELERLCELFDRCGIEYKLDASDEEVEESIKLIREACDEFLKG